MLRAKYRQTLEKQARGDKGFTLIELLVVVIIIGILAAVAIPVFLGQRQKAFDAGVQSDLKNLATSAETTFTDSLSYPAAAATFASNGTTPIITKDTAYVAYTDATGSDAGYVIYGKATGSDIVWVVSSYNGGAPTKAGTVAGAVTFATLSAAPAASDAALKTPATFAPSAAISIP